LNKNPYLETGPKNIKKGYVIFMAAIPIPLAPVVVIRAFSKPYTYCSVWRAF
jgi:hypothetical protein